MEYDYKVSIIIPVYNTEEYIEKCLSSVINQTFKEIEIIIINDHSEGNIDNIIQKYIVKSNIKYIKPEKKLFLGGCRNLGIDIASGDYLYFCDSDDWLDITTIEELYKNTLNTNAEIGICPLYRDYGWSNGVYISKYDDVHVLDGKTAFGILTKEYDFGITISSAPNNKLYKKTFLQNNNFKFIDNCFYEETYFNFRVFNKAFKVVCISNGKYHYYKRPTSILQTISIQHIDDFYFSFRKIKDFLLQENALDHFMYNYCSFIEYFFNILINQIFNNVNDEIERKKFLRYFINKMKQLVSIDDFWQYINTEKLRHHLQPSYEIQDFMTWKKT